MSTSFRLGVSSSRIGDHRIDCGRNHLLKVGGTMKQASATSIHTDMTGGTLAGSSDEDESENTQEKTNVDAINKGYETEELDSNSVSSWNFDMSPLKVKKRPIDKPCLLSKGSNQSLLFKGSSHSLDSDDEDDMLLPLNDDDDDISMISHEFEEANQAMNCVVGRLIGNSSIDTQNEKAREEMEKKKEDLRRRACEMATKSRRSGLQRHTSLRTVGKQPEAEESSSIKPKRTRPRVSKSTSMRNLQQREATNTTSEQRGENASISRRGALKKATSLRSISSLKMESLETCNASETPSPKSSVAPLGRGLRRGTSWRSMDEYAAAIGDALHASNTSPHLEERRAARALRMEKVRLRMVREKELKHQRKQEHDQLEDEEPKKHVPLKNLASKFRTLI